MRQGCWPLYQPWNWIILVGALLLICHERVKPLGFRFIDLLSSGAPRSGVVTADDLDSLRSVKAEDRTGPVSSGNSLGSFLKHGTLTAEDSESLQAQDRVPPVSGERFSGSMVRSSGCSHEQLLHCLVEATATSRSQVEPTDEFHIAYYGMLEKMGAVLPQGGSCSAPPRPALSCSKGQKTCSNKPVFAKPCSGEARKLLSPTCHCHAVDAWQHMKQSSTAARFSGKRVLFYGSGPLRQIYEHFVCAIKVLNLNVHTELKPAQSDGQVKGRGGYTILQASAWDLVVVCMGSHYNIVGTGTTRKWPAKYALGMKTFFETVKMIASQKASPPKLLWLEPPAQHFPNGTYTKLGHAQLTNSCVELSEELWYNASWRIRITNPLMKQLGIEVLPLFNLSFRLWSDHPLGPSKDCSNYCTTGPFLIHATMLLFIKWDSMLTR